MQAILLPPQRGSPMVYAKGNGVWFDSGHVHDRPRTVGVKLPALRFEAEAFQLGGDKIHGRQSAGEAFLRAALALPVPGSL